MKRCLTTAADATQEKVCACPSGSQVISGGYYRLRPDGVSSSYPDTTRKAWVVSFAGVAGDPAYVYAVCVPVSQVEPPLLE